MVALRWLLAIFLLAGLLMSLRPLAPDGSPENWFRHSDKLVHLSFFALAWWLGVKAGLRPGWRLGFGVMRRDLAQHVARLMTNSNSCTASFTQLAGVEALRGDQSCVAYIREQFRQRRQVMVEGLNRLPGVSCRMPRGAFYAFPNITATGRQSDPLADSLLTEAGVACLAGTAFGNWGEGYLRFSFANSVENIQRALEKIEGWLRKNA